LASVETAKLAGNRWHESGNAGVPPAGVDERRRSNLIANAIAPMTDFWHHLAPFAGAFHSLIAIVAGAIIVVVRKYLQRVRENQAAMWPSADGQVQTATVKRSQYGSWVEVAYRYYARQAYRYGKYRRHFARKSAAQAFADAIRGRSIQVRYREDNPNESVVLEQDLQMAGVLQTG